MSSWWASSVCGFCWHNKIITTGLSQANVGFRTEVLIRLQDTMRLESFFQAISIDQVLDVSRETTDIRFRHHGPYAYRNRSRFDGPGILTCEQDNRHLRQHRL
jgi:hypothetical protein